MPTGEHAHAQPRNSRGFAKKEGRRAHVPWQEQAKQARAALKQTKDDYETDLATLQSDYTRATRQLCAAQDLAIANVLQQHQAELAALKEEHRREMYEATRLRTDERGELQDQCAAYRATISENDRELGDVYDQLDAAEQKYEEMKSKHASTAGLLRHSAQRERGGKTKLAQEKARHLATKNRLHDAREALKLIRDEMDAREAELDMNTAGSEPPAPGGVAATPGGGPERTSPPGGPAPRYRRRGHTRSANAPATFKMNVICATGARWRTAC